MARLTPRVPSRGLKPGISRWFSGLFCRRSIIIIADHKTQHVPFSAAAQLGLMAAALAFVGWASFSSGSYVAAQKVLEEKEKKLASTTQESERLAAEFALLKMDLGKIAQDGKNAKSSDVAKILAEHASGPTVANLGDAADEQYSAVFKRIDYLENKVKDLQANHDQMMSDIRATTGGKIKELEQVIARTGLPGQAVERAAELKRTQEEQRREKYGRIEGKGGQGGPFQPLPSSVLKEKETELYFNLRRMMTLNDVVSSMPLAVPMAGDDYRRTSGFGTRVDPFRGVLAFHSGVDLSGPTGAKVLATNDGKVEFAGWKAAYGNVVDVKHEYGLSTRYAHLSRVLVQPDQVVKKGQVIGIQGSTGRSTGSHLHYEVRYNGTAINPSNFLKAGEDVRTVD